MTSLTQSLRSQAVRPLLSIALGLCATFVFLAWQAPTANAGSCTFTSGEATNSWHVAANWDCLEVPSSTTPVIIPNGQQVDIRTDVEATCGSLTINATGTLKPWGSTLHVYGDVDKIGTFTAGTSTIDFTGTNDQMVGTMTYKNVTVTKASGTVTAIAGQIITGTLVTSGGGTYNSNASNIEVTGITTIGAGTTVTSTSGVLTFTGAVTNAGSIGSVNGNKLFSSTLANTGTLVIGAGTATTTLALTGAGTIKANTGTMVVMANMTGFTSFVSEASTLKLYTAGATDQSIDGAAFYNIYVTKAGGTATFTATGATAMGTLYTTGAGTLSSAALSFQVNGASTIGTGTTVTSTTGTLTFASMVLNYGNLGSSNGNQLLSNTLLNNGTFDVGSGTATTTNISMGGTINNNSGRLVLEGYWTSPGTYNAQSGTVRIAGAGDYLMDGRAFNNLEMLKTGGTATLQTTNATVAGTFVTAGAGALSSAALNFSVTGVSTIGAGTTVTSTLGALTFTGAVTNAGSIGTISGNKLFSSTLANTGTLVIGAGTATTTLAFTGAGTIKGDTGTLVVMNNMTGFTTFTGGASTLRVYSAGATDQSIKGGAFFNLEIKKGGGTATITDAHATVGGTFITLGAGTLDSVAKNLTVTGLSTIGTGTTVTSTTGTLTFATAVTNDGSLGSSNGNMLLSGVLLDNGTFDVGSGTATTTGISLVGTLNVNSGRLVLAGYFTDIGTFNVQSGTVRIAGAGNFDVTGENFNNLEVQKTAGTATFITTSPTVAGTLVTSGAGAISTAGLNLTVTGISTIGTGTTVTSTSGNLNFNGAATNNGTIGSGIGNESFLSTLANNGTLQVGGLTLAYGNLTNSGTGIINGGSTGILEVRADFADTGTFNAQSGTFRIGGGATQSVKGEAFNKLTMTKTAGTATFTSNATVAGTLITSTSGVGTLNADTFNLSVTGASTIADNTTVTSTSGTLTFTGAATNAGSIGSVNGNKLFGSTLNNTGGTLVIGSGVATSTGALTGAGTIKGNTGTLVASSTLAFATFTAGTGTLRLYGHDSVNITGATFYNLDVKKNGGTATIITNAPTVGGNLTTEGAGTLSSVALALTVTGASTIGSGTTVTSTSGALTLGTVTNSGNIGSGTGVILFTALTNSAGTVNLPGNSTSTGSVALNGGTLKLNSHLLSVGGGWTNGGGTFTPVTGTVRFYGAGTRNIGGESTFYNVTFNNTGLATLTGNATSTGTFAVGTGGELAVGAYRYAASGATYTNNGLITIAAGGKTVHALTSSLLTDSTGAHITTNTNPGLVFVTIADADANLNGTVADTITARVTNTAAAGGDTELMTLVETGVATGIFRNTTFFPLVASGSIVQNNGQFEISAAGTGDMAYANLYDASDTGTDSVTIALTGSAPGSGDSTGGGGGGGGIPSTVTTYQSSASDPDRPKNLANLATQGVNIHALVKLPDDGNVNTQEDSAVYYIGADGKRHAFPNSKVFFTWYADFSGVTVVSASQMASIPLGKNVIYKPGSRMVKFLSLNDTYVVTSGGTLRWVKTEAVATALYGTNWNTMIDDIDDTFFGSYKIGDPINAASDIDLAGIKVSATTVSNALGL